MDSKKSALCGFVAGVVVAGAAYYLLNKSSQEINQEKDLAHVLSYIDNNRYHNETILNYALDRSEGLSPRTYDRLATLTKDGIESYPEKLKWRSIEIAKMTLESDFKKELLHELDTPHFLSMIDGYLEINADLHAENTLYMIDRTLERIIGISELPVFGEIDAFLKENLVKLKSEIRKKLAIGGEDA